MEAALKLTIEYFRWTGEPGRTNFIARHESYHGTTIGALSVSGRQSTTSSPNPLPPHTNTPFP
jgi:adenosylmethionine-8-amino-7-oxononanoate aminotransferase